VRSSAKYGFSSSARRIGFQSVVAMGRDDRTCAAAD
jgi:hypothetical protein